MAFSVPLLTMDLLLDPCLLLLLAAALVAGPLLSAVAMWRRSRGRKRLYHRVVGTNFQMLLHFRQQYDYATNLSRRHRTFRILNSPFHSDVYTCDPAVVEHILRTNFQNYGKGTFNYGIMNDLLGDGIFAVDGAHWRHQRKLASHEFSTRALKDISGAVFKKNSVRLAQAVAEVADSNQAIDLQDWFVKSTMDSIFEVSFGTELNSLQGTNAETREFLRALDESTELINRRYIDPLWKVMRFINVGSAAVLKDNVRIIDDYIHRLIRSKIAQMSNQKVDKLDILSRFLNERPNDPENLTDRYLRDIILNFIIAGKDTTAGTLSWFIYLLCRHPPVEEKIFEEVKEAVGAKGGVSVEEFAANVTEESLGKMTYLHAAITETLRLYPAVPLDGKICFSDDSLPDGYDVKAGEFILYQPYAMGRMKYLWGEDAEIFRPERWLDADGNFCPESPFKFTAFQAGPRICLGKEFAYRQMKIFAAVLLRFFTFKLRDEEEAVHYKMTFTLFMNPGLNVHVFHR
ncbi:unnamed protein product [Spirodela intermedia]|uniref:Uncharacterized protein n=1 Tax=Spirodela intermedia TaxID=51605 RepID=A0A7I8K555_SPIIN|nr:unnamed protein product [Spirodela intermedia]